MEAAIKSERKARVGMIRTLEQGGAHEIVTSALSLELYPESLDPKPILWPRPYQLSSEVRIIVIYPIIQVEA